MTVINYALIGPGLVGKEFLAQVSAFTSQKVSYRLVGLMNSTKMEISPSGNLSSTSSLTLPSDLNKFISSLPENTIIVDCTSSPQIAEMYPQILISKHIITPNKKPFSSSLQLYKSIKSSLKFVYHESSVGAGLPILSTLSDLVLTGDEIVKVEGILSGTLSYIFNTFSSTTEPFSKVVAKAKSLGYTEPDPRDDLNGMDVARKVVILARESGLEVDLENVDVENIVPESLRGLNVDEFMEKLGEADTYFDKLNKAAIAEGKVLRYVGSIQDGKCKVKLEKYEKSHPFGSLKGSDNVIAITTRRFPNPLIVQGAGAGAGVTAFGIFSDLIKITKVMINGPL